MTNERKITRRQALKGLALTAGALAVPKVDYANLGERDSNETFIEFIKFSSPMYLPYAPEIDRCIHRKDKRSIHPTYYLPIEDGSYEILLPTQNLREEFQRRMKQEESIRPMTENEKESFIKNSKSEIKDFELGRSGLWPHVQQEIRRELEILMKEINNGKVYNEFGDGWKPTCYLPPLSRMSLPKKCLDDLSQNSLVREAASQHLDEIGLKSFIDWETTKSWRYWK